MHTQKTKAAAADKAGMDEKTSRKYLRMGKLPSEVAQEHTWRTREDPFAEVWEEVRRKLEINSGLEAKTLFEDLQRRYQSRFADGQLRTLQRAVKRWRALEGPPKEVFFDQVHHPGRLCQSDFTSMNELDVTITRQPFEHLLYHFVLPFSDWETGTVCFSECFEALSLGFQNALWELGGVPEAHRSDCLTAAVHKLDHPEEFTQRYAALLRHYGLKGHKTQPNSPHENGDVEQRHFRLKKAVDQALMLRGSRDFDSRKEYEGFLSAIFKQLNTGRTARLQQELKTFRRLPPRRFPAWRREDVRVSAGSTIRAGRNTYSVDSRLIGEKVRVRLYSEHLEVWYAQKCVERIPRLRGEGKHHIQYRHIIEWLVRKPGAFENYRYREDLFPSLAFRMAYDGLKAQHTAQKAAKEYLNILQLAAAEGESLVEQALGSLLELGGPIHFYEVQMFLNNWKATPGPVAAPLHIEPVDLRRYDGLLGGKAAM
ncbi:MAG: IS21 family transposase [Chloroflexota bacterium]